MHRHIFLGKYKNQLIPAKTVKSMKCYARTPEHKQTLLDDVISPQNALFTNKAPEDLGNLQ